MAFYYKFFCLICVSLFLYSCNGKIPGADARKVSYDPNERVKKKPRGRKRVQNG